MEEIFRVELEYKYYMRKIWRHGQNSRGKHSFKCIYWEQRKFKNKLTIQIEKLENQKKRSSKK